MYYKLTDGCWLVYYVYYDVGIYCRKFSSKTQDIHISTCNLTSTSITSTYSHYNTKIILRQNITENKRNFACGLTEAYN